MSQYNYIDIEAGVTWDTPSSPSMTLTVMSGFQKDSTVGWYANANVIVLSGSTTYAKFTADRGLYQYMTWIVGNLSGAAAATIWVRGIGRMRQA